MKKVLLILPNGFEIFEGAAFIDVLGWANACGDTEIEVVKAGLTERVSCTFGGFEITSLCLLSDIDSSEFNALAIPGGFERSGYYREAFSETVLSTIREFDQNQKTIASICVGALPIAKSGVLVGRKATTYHLDEGRWRQQLGQLGAEVVDAPIVVDRNIITSTSPSTAIDVSLLLVESLSSKANALHVKKQMGFD